MDDKPHDQVLLFSQKKESLSERLNTNCWNRAVFGLNPL